MKLLVRLGQSPVAVGIVISLIVCSAVLGLRGIRGLEFLELTAYDFYTRIVSAQVKERELPFVLITVAEDDIRKQGRWPLSDRTLASLIRVVSEGRPRAIGLDIFRDIPVPPGSAELESVFSEVGNIVTIKKIGDEKSMSVSAPYMAKNPDLVGFNDIIIDRGGIVRRGLLFMHDGQTASYSFPLILALIYLDKEGITAGSEEGTDFFRLGKTTYVPFGGTPSLEPLPDQKLEANDGSYIRADARGYQFLLDFSEFRIPMRSFSLTEVLSKKVPASIFNDKIVLIGVNAVSLKDFFYSPFSRGEGDEGMPGVELHARIANQIISSATNEHAQNRHLSEGKEWVWVLIWSLSGGMLGIWARSLRRFLALGGISIPLLIIVTFLAFRAGWWIPVIPPGISWLFAIASVTTYNVYRERKDRSLLMHLFSRHVSTDVAEAIWQQREQFMDGSRPRPQKIVATVLFTDLKGFTSISEKMDPQTLMDWLNEYMEAMALIVIGHGGVVNKYIGDAVMAVFGVPVGRTTAAEIRADAKNAVRCALAMGDALMDLNRGWQERDLPAAKMRVGIYTGELVAGSLGSAQRMEYTVIGDTVNIASRLESFDKDDAKTGPEGAESICRVLVGADTQECLGEEFATRKIGEVSLKGKEEKIAIYMVAGHKAGTNLEQKEN